jgi:putative transposase
MNDENKQRRSIRLKNYDYRQAGAYFVTIVAQNRNSLFGYVVDGTMQLNTAGQMVQSVWDALPTKYPHVEIDFSMVMPNHFHGVIVLVGAGPCACPEFRRQPLGVAPTDNSANRTAMARTLSLPDVVHRFKTLTTQRYVLGVKDQGWPRFNRRLWQRNYFEHVIRSEDSLKRIRDYILKNPTQWEFDRENPLALKPKAAEAWLL